MQPKQGGGEGVSLVSWEKVATHPHTHNFFLQLRARVGPLRMRVCAVCGRSCGVLVDIYRQIRITKCVMVFTVTEKKMREADGAVYALSNYREGVDYVARRAFKGVRYMFRKGILEERGVLEQPEVSVVDPSLVEHKQADEPVVIEQIDEKPLITEVKQPEPPKLTVKEYLIAEAAKRAEEPATVKESLTVEPAVIQRPSALDDVVREARVVRKLPNQRYVDTDLCGRVYVGGKGNMIRLNQLIAVKNGNLVVR